ncbi:hypothetical protein EDD21DRAFT_213249 [Dissophora ornata]|nr:hypothetical protein BGZ58_005454 [Dissophora ornata]KAI8604505.1 hypothetical protein EDD21DRAFT_213249 [Dissophora ornata]
MNPLDLPDIALEVAPYLKRRDHVRCAYVCKAWYRSFLPAVWEEVSIKSNPDGVILKGPLPEVLERHRELVLKLDAEDIAEEQLNIEFPNLVSVTLSQYRRSTVITMNPSIVHLRLYNNGAHFSSTFWNALSAALPRLESLSVGSGVMFGFDVKSAFWTACLPLKELELDTMVMGSRLVPDGIRFPRMRVLKLDTSTEASAEEQIGLLCLFPALEELTWKSGKDTWTQTTIWESFSEKIACGTWPSLQKLYIQDAIRDGHVGAILESMPQQPIKLMFASSSLQDLGFSALRRHFDGLRSLDFPNCHALESPKVVEILTSCPALEAFRGFRVQAKDIVDGKPWSCLSLRKLAVGIVFDEWEEDLQPLVFKRLSDLTRLQHLTVGHGVLLERLQFQYSLDLRLQSGLGALSRLREMRHLNVTGTRQALDKEDIRWMQVHWRQLEEVGGALNMDPTVGEALEIMLLSSYYDLSLYTIDSL